MRPEPTSPMRFHAQLQELMRRGVTKIRWLFDEAKKLGYKGSFGHMARYVAQIRSLARANSSPAPAERIVRSLPLDPTSGSRISQSVESAQARNVWTGERRLALCPDASTPRS